MSYDRSDNQNKSPELDLLSLEKLDRSSPDLWPEPIPGIAEFQPIKTPDKSDSQSKWMADFDKDDTNMVHELGNLSTVQLMQKVKDLMNLAYQLGLEESNQMTRGRLLNILESKSLD